ncbi:hypothetical protein N7519_002845 [Penicillium mononematosum]|uniref:uncharacterized protein n=1 Tax=Penicillium mononematosum TaxID=268346 RepID=UPI0025494701|nr:uncharacterized protein N7519_002845 [Penicillium mononematosum]KAJ6187937.1 hypothetical protein N7519_002845 [Penicillium mononematosum]
MSTTPMTPSTEVYLPAYNGQENLKSAFSWSLIRIRIFMFDVIDNPSTYGMDREVVPELRRLCTDIVDLSQKGSNYQSEASYPQTILRIVNPAGASEDESYLLLDKTTHGGLPYWCSFDLLVQHPRVPQITISTYLLTLMYANWCRKIAPRSPYVYSCVWAEKNGKQSRFHLGASLGGYTTPKPGADLWVRILQQARFNILRDQRIDTVGITAWSSNLKGRTIKIIPFGNCAETYPLAHLLRNRNSREEVYGLAVMPPKSSRDAYSHSQALKTLLRPCANCQRVIGLWGGKVENFITDEMPGNSTAAPSGVQSPTSRGPGPRASGSGIALPTRRKRPSPDNGTDTPEPTPKKPKGPEMPRKPSQLAKGKGKPQ